MRRVPFHDRKSRRVQIRLFLLLAALLTTFECVAASSSLPGEWPTYGNGPAHTGYFPGTLNGLPFIQKWRVTLPNFNVSQAAAGGGRVFVTVGWYYGPMSLRALDASTGQPLWTQNFAAAFAINPPTYSDGAVYVQWSEGGVNPAKTFKFDAATGVTNWSANFTDQSHRYLAPVVADGTVYFGTGYYVELSGYNRTNGALRFAVPLIGNGCDEWTPACSNGKVYSWVNGFLSEHNPLTGARNWTLTNANQNEFLYSMKRSLAIDNGRAYFTSTTKLMAADLALRTNLWAVSGPFSGTPAVANGMVYAISNSAVSAYTTDGVFVRTYYTSNSVETLGGQLIVMDDVLLVAGSYGVYVFRLADGTLQQLISSYRPSCGCYQSSKISLANDTLYISSGDSSLYAYTAANLWQFTITSSSSGAYGSPAPNPYGTNYVISGSTVTNTVASPISGPTGTRYLVTGWTGTGSIPASGNTNTIAFVAGRDSTLTWNFKTQYFLDTGVNSSGTVNISDSWWDSGSNATITATPAPYYHFVNWSGDLSGTSNVIVVPMTGPRAATANFTANLVTNGVPQWWLAQFSLPVNDAGALADTDGDSFANWKEYRAGTDPLDPASLLRVTAVPPPPWDPGQFILRWPSTYNRTYRLWSTTNLSAGFSLLATNIYPNPPFNYYYFYNIQTNPPGFYWIQIE